MNATPELRERLKTLAIPKDQRPTGPRASAARGSSVLGRVVFLFLLMALAGGGYVFWPRLSPLLLQARDLATPPREVRAYTVRVEVGSGPPPALTATGKIVSDHLVEVVTKVSGQIVGLEFEQGDRVQQGQVLARLEDVNYRARRDQAAALVQKARADVEFREYELRRIERLFQTAKGSERELAEARRLRDEAVAQLAADEAALVFAQKALSDTQVVAPISGVVLERNVEVGDFVAAEGGRGANANAQFATIADMSKLRVEVDVSELDVARVRKDMPCIMTPDAYKDRRYPGYVMWLDPAANYAKATVQVKVRIENADEFLRIEGVAQVTFLSEAPDPAAAQESTIRVPAGACRLAPDSAEAEVLLIENDVLQSRKIAVGRNFGSTIEVREGLRGGERIVASELEGLVEGLRVRVVE